MAEIQLEKTALGLELGSTRIKAVLIGPEHAVLASGAHDWENRLEHGYWTYALDDVWAGVQDAFARLARQVQERYGTPLHTVGAMGVSGMMHGYLPFARDGAQLAAFRTWRNTTTERAAALLTERFAFNVPQRWSVAHLYQAILDGEPHARDIAYLTTLAGYVHWRLTGERVLGVGEASGMFPIDSVACGYDAGMEKTFDALLAAYRVRRAEGQTLEEYLADTVFRGAQGSVQQPDAADTAGFARFLTDYKSGLAVEKAAAAALR